MAGLEDRTHPLAAEARGAGEPVGNLADLRDMEGSDAGGRLAAWHALDELDHDRVSLFDANLYHRTIANLVARATGRSGSVRHVDTPEEARAWLAELRDAGMEGEG